MNDSGTDDYGEWLRLAEEAFGALSHSQPGGGISPGLNGFTANWITRYGALARAAAVFHWLTNTRSSSSVEPGEM